MSSKSIRGFSRDARPAAPPLEAQLREAFPSLSDADFDYYATDLYVRGRPDVVKWLKENYQFYSQIQFFRPNVPDGVNAESPFTTYWLDLPFQGLWPKAMETKTNV